MHETTSPPTPATPAAQDVAARPSWPRRAGAALLRLLALAALLAGGAATFLVEERFRFAEAAWTAWILRGPLSRPSRTLTTEPVFLYQQVPGDDASWAGLAVTTACTAAFYLGGVLVVSGLLLLSRRNSVPRVLAAALAAITLLATVNTARMILIAEAQARWGAQGFGWTHTVVGSFLMVVTLGVCAVLFARLGLLRRGR